MPTDEAGLSISVAGLSPAVEDGVETVAIPGTTEARMGAGDHPLLRPYAGAVERLAEIPGLRVESAQQIIAEIGPTAEVFPSQKALSSWVGVCPGEEVTAGETRRSRSPKGNRTLRRLLNEAAHAQSRGRKGKHF